VTNSPLRNRTGRVFNFTRSYLPRITTPELQGATFVSSPIYKSCFPPRHPLPTPRSSPTATFGFYRWNRRVGLHLLVFTQQRAGVDCSQRLSVGWVVQLSAPKRSDLFYSFYSLFSTDTRPSISRHSIYNPRDTPFRTSDPTDFQSILRLHRTRRSPLPFEFGRDSMILGKPSWERL
jgi:hypothetical protein